MVLAKEGWHPGVLGIVAARLAEAYHRPVAMVSLQNGRGRGSARSVEGFHLFKGLQACRGCSTDTAGMRPRRVLKWPRRNLRPCKTSWSRPFRSNWGLSRPGPP